jgi:nitrite reductase/ring-hydroxylating ferredoxin subunit
MLTREQNDTLTRVGRGTPMGEYFRRFWIPFLLSWELEPDGEPERVRILGENLVAFRDTTGRVGLIAENCPHRGASMFYGRNEYDGLACIYHGWKFDAAGVCVDMPSEPDESNFKEKVKIVSYPCVERGGIVWTYMGPKDQEQPELPGLEWLNLPASQIVASKRVQKTNWLQALEGEIDQSHLSFTHSRLKEGEGPGVSGRLVNLIRQQDKHPRFEVVDTDYGVCIGAGRNAPDGQKYWRVSQFLAPSHIMTGPYGENPMRNWRMWVPMDDTSVMCIGLYFHPSEPFSGERREFLDARGGVWTISPDVRKPRNPALPFGRWYSTLDLDNDFGMDRDVQRNEIYSGLTEFFAQDAAPQAGMGVIYDRRKEHLGTSDLGIIGMRRWLLRATKELAETGRRPELAVHPEWYAVRSDATIIPAEERWFPATEERRKATPGVNPDAP